MIINYIYNTSILIMINNSRFSMNDFPYPLESHFLTQLKSIEIKLIFCPKYNTNHSIISHINSHFQFCIKKIFLIKQQHTSRTFKLWFTFNITSLHNHLYVSLLSIFLYFPSTRQILTIWIIINSVNIIN
jgi:hypothetical protein